jgi:hypothetical protein
MWKKNFFPFAGVIFVCCCFLSCGTTAPPDKGAAPGKADGLSEENFWNAVPVDNELIFHGTAGILSDRGKSIRLALEDAARKLAVFNAVEGRFYSYTRIGAGALDYRSETQTALNYDQNYKSYVESLSFDPERDVRQSGNAIFVRARYRSPVPVSIPPIPRSPGGREKPAWIDTPPLIGGYLVGLGHAGRRSSPGDTVNVSFESAVFSIIKNTSTLMTGTTEDYQGSGVLDFSSSAGGGMISGGILKGFYVLDTWTDPQTWAVWTLAIAREAFHY